MDSSPIKAAEPTFDFPVKKKYVPPSWAQHLSPVSSHFLSLGHFPTPIHKWDLPNLPKNTEVYIKRDDLTGMQLSGNKVRKLEFLIADAMKQGADCVITIGGMQSNHCRATAVAAKYAKLDCYLILHTSNDIVDKDPGFVGNLLIDRLVAANIELVSEDDYTKIGDVALTNILKKKLLNEGKRPYVIPMGGSNSISTWGYIEAIREIKEQQKNQTTREELAFDNIIVACGSGCTLAGLALGSRLSNLNAKVRAYSIWGEPDYFYEYAQNILDGLQANVNIRHIAEIEDAQGLGDAVNTDEELSFIKEIAEATGVILDPVYSGKAAYAMMKEMAKNPIKWEGKRVLFVHTGGLLGFYDKTDQMGTLVRNCRRMDLRKFVRTKKNEVEINMEC